MAQKSERYTLIAIFLHWIMAVALVAMIASGWYMSGLEDGAPGQYALYQVHKSVGITILVLTIARCLWRLVNPPPPLPPDMNRLEKMASHTVHAGFYVVMIALPLTGWLYVSVNPDFDVPTVLYGLVSWPDMPTVPAMRNTAVSDTAEMTHEVLAWIMLALLALHVAGALKHETGSETGVLKRMIPGLFGRTTKPERPARGYGLAFGIAGGVFVLIVGMPFVAGAPVSSRPDRQIVPDDLVANWIVDREVSTIGFSGMHDGKTYSGRFEDWEARIRFDPDNPQAGRAQILVRTGRVTTNSKLYTDSLKAGEWLDPAVFPVAHAEVFDIVPRPDGSYVSTVRLTLKGRQVETPLAFTLRLDDRRAEMSGQATFRRGPLDLGQSSDPAGDWVGEDVRIDVSLQALRRD